MICRFQRRIFPNLVSIQKQRFLTNASWEDDVYNSHDHRLKVAERLETAAPEIPKIQSPSMQFQYDFIIDEQGYVNVYTDGACHSNGLENPKAGIGVWFGDDHPLNVSRAVVGRSTCNVAEIMAATHAMRQAKKAGVQKLKVNTDSKFVIMCVTDWMKKWKLVGWRTTNKKPVINKEELIELESAMSSLDVIWAHVPSHCGIEGNEQAHLLAKGGIYNVEETQT